VRLTLTLMLLAALLLPAAILAAEREEPPPPPPLPATPDVQQQQALPPVATPAPVPGLHARPSRAVGRPWDGRLVRGRLLPVSGDGYVTWDAIRHESPNRRWRRYGTGRLVRVLTQVLADFNGARPVLVGDLSRPDGGDFGARYGGLGHASHQNGLDADVYYPRTDGRLLAPRNPGQVDRRAAQRLVDRFVRAGAENVFVGPSLGLRGPKGVVEELVHHDDHLHVRLPG
jgi:murein endopeptidase